MNAITMSFTGRKRIRKSFGRIPENTPMPNLIDVQRSSYEAFLQMNVHPDKRTHSGLQEVFKSVFPIDDFAGRGRLEFVYYELEEPKYDVEECIQRGMTYAAPLKVILRLIVWDLDEDTGARSIRDIKEQPVYMGDMPLMTDNGTFIINGTERVIVSQMHRSPGVFFDHDKGKTHSSGKYLFAARVIPYRGSWLDFEFDAKDLVYVRIDRRRKLPATTLLLALYGSKTEETLRSRASRGEGLADDEERFGGMSAEEILAAFYDTITYKRSGKGWKTGFDPERMKGVKLTTDLVDAASGSVVAEAGTKLTPRVGKKLQADGLKEIFISNEELVGRYIASDLMEGRETATRGYALAAEYAASLFKLWGIKPAGDMPMMGGFRMGGVQHAKPTTPHLPELLVRLKRANLRIGVASMDGEAAVRATLERLDLSPFIDFVAGYDSGHGIKPEPGMVLAFARQCTIKPTQVAVVGDSPHDLAMGRAAGAGLVVGFTGGGGVRDLLAPNADHIIERLEDLLGLLRATA